MTEKVFGKKFNTTKDQELLYSSGPKIDPKDPTYDSETEGDFFLSSFQPRPIDQSGDRTKSSNMTARDGDTKKLSIEEFTVKSKKLIEDYYISQNPHDVIEALKVFDCSSYHDSFVVKAIRLALDRTDTEQKLTSELITILYDAKVITRAHVARALEKLVQSIEDIKLDVPDGPDRLLTFFDCAGEDGVVDQGLMRRLPETFLLQFSPSILKEFPSLQKQLEELQAYKVALDNFELDFFNSGEVSEARNFLTEHETRAFRHEFVRHLVKGAMLNKTDRQREMVSLVLSALYSDEHGDLVVDDVKLGFSRMLGSLDDLSLDCPDASDLLAKFLARAVVDEIIPPAFIIDSMRLHIGGPMGIAVLEKVWKWVSEEKGHMLAGRFRKVWTGTDPERVEAREFKQNIQIVIEAYFRNFDKEDSRTSFNLMDMSPDQESELVRKILRATMDYGEKQRKAGLELIEYLLANKELNSTNVAKGFTDLFLQAPDIVLDVKDVDERMTAFVKDAKERKILLADFELPTKLCFK